MMYTFFYCLFHDDGFIITGNQPYVPDDYFMQHCDTCDFGDWCKMGVIEYNGFGFDIIEPVTFDYDKYGGGFIFRLYQDTLTDEKGNELINEELDEWIRAQME